MKVKISSIFPVYCGDFVVVYFQAEKGYYYTETISYITEQSSIKRIGKKEYMNALERVGKGNERLNTTN